MAQTAAQLRKTLMRISGRGYRAYRDIRGEYEFEEFDLFIDHVQGDPFASPSRVRVRVPQSRARMPEDCLTERTRRVALCDFLARKFGRAAQAASRRAGTGKSGLIANAPTGQEILERTSVVVTSDYVESRFVVGLPAQGRKVVAREAIRMFFEGVPAIVRQSLRYEALDAAALERHVRAAEIQHEIRQQLASRKLVAFLGDDSVLPRRSGVDDRPLGEGAVHFRSPDSLRVTFDLGVLGTFTGLGIPEGVTLIVGGGYHGKSTLLRALEHSVYDHQPDDGRELVVTHEQAMKIRAEDGRYVEKVTITPFISNLPYGQSSHGFSTENASGSTSQAANILEAVEAGAKVLLLDEDTSATNFMIRDARMQALVAKEKEPITPFIDRVKQLHRELGVSTILVMGGSGDYFAVADTVILMADYLAQDVTKEAKELDARHPAQRQQEGGNSFGEVVARRPLAQSFDPSKGKRDVKIRARGLDTISFGTDDIDLSAVEQLVDPGQTDLVGDVIWYLARKYVDGQRTMAELLDLLERELEERGLDHIGPFINGAYVRARRLEIAAAINRLRSLRCG